MRAGKLRHRVTFQRERTDADGSPTVSDGGGGYALDWIDLFTTWASIEPLRGREALAAQQLEAAVTHKIRMRWREGVNAAQRIVFGSRSFNIREVRLLREIRHEIEIMAEEGVAT